MPRSRLLLQLAVIASFGCVGLTSAFTRRSLASSFVRPHQQHHQHYHYDSLPIASTAKKTATALSISTPSNNAGYYTDDEWHPHDPAHSTPQLLAGLWTQIANGLTLVKGESATVIYPDMRDKLSPRFINLLMAHLDSCKDVCDDFGITMTLQPFQRQNDTGVSGFTVKSFRNPEKSTDNYDFAYDPFWDDGTDFEELYSGIDDEDMAKDPYPEIVNKVPDDDNEIIEVSKAWVNKMMSDMGICPFTQGAERAGLPLGQVFYCVDRSHSFEDMYARYWKEVVRVEQHKEKDLSTTLLICPEFCMDNVEMFESFSTTLTQPLTALGIEDLLQLVFFHPDWVFRDGDARSGDGKAANYARRSAWPMINILRTSQVRAAQKGIPTGLVYKQNEKTLTGIGVDKLETMLRLRDWQEIEDIKVNRKEYDALKIAQEYQETGVVKQKDISIEHDTTVAANKVDRRQMDQGNLVNVLQQALEKRLGVSGAMVPLSGPETSATAMAVDFLLQELDAVAAAPARAPATAEEASTGDMSPEARRAQRMADAKAAMLAEMVEAAAPEATGGDRGFGDPMSDALFGKGGIPDSAIDPAAISDDFNPMNM